jgi:hypothetical protein
MRGRPGEAAVITGSWLDRSARSHAGKGAVALPLSCFAALRRCGLATIGGGGEAVWQRRGVPPSLQNPVVAADPKLPAKSCGVSLDQAARRNRHPHERFKREADAGMRADWS